MSRVCCGNFRLNFYVCFQRWKTGKMQQNARFTPLHNREVVITENRVKTGKKVTFLAKKVTLKLNMIIAVT